MPVAVLSGAVPSPPCQAAQPGGRSCPPQPAGQPTAHGPGPLPAAARACPRGSGWPQRRARSGREGIPARCAPGPALGGIMTGPLVAEVPVMARRVIAELPLVAARRKRATWAGPDAAVSGGPVLAPDTRQARAAIVACPPRTGAIRGGVMGAVPATASPGAPSGSGRPAGWCSRFCHRRAAPLHETGWRSQLTTRHLPRSRLLGWVCGQPCDALGSELHRSPGRAWRDIPRGA